jgi:hypothetical protein
MTARIIGPHALVDESMVVVVLADNQISPNVRFFFAIDMMNDCERRQWLTKGILCYNYMFLRVSV